MSRPKDRRKFLLDGREVAIREKDLLIKALQDLVADRIRSFGIAQISLEEFGLSEKTAEEIAADLNVAVSFAGSQAIFSSTN